MKRRGFIGTAAAAAAITGLFCSPQSKSSASSVPEAGEGWPDGLTPEGVLKEYRYWMFEDFVP
ncbi:MAG: hypothetical protein ACYC9O_15800, partial [Candidatus Latescibacterota bacterium]